ncbi:sugar phosphate isomerase/epimerase [Chloroflexi bacterium TSY]|nr:sugar phosphate isomerase/epimerase [Chloroflexi bacterium TSY]
MRKLGVHLMVWSGQVGDEELALLPQIKKMGYDGVEIPIFDPDSLDVSAIRSSLQDCGLSCTTSTALPDGINLIDSNTSVGGVRWLQSVVRKAAELGASILCGPMLVPVGELRGRGYTSDEWALSVQSLQEVGKTAEENGVTLALEPLNRFETFMINTVADGVRLMEQVNHPSIGLLLDTFHMHIEEKSTPDAIRLAKQSQ